MKLFLGSTFEDLKFHREKAIEALRRYLCRIEAMELWEAKPDDPLAVCLNRVLESDVYICVLAFRYGSIAPSGKSFTQMEYEAALSAGKKILVFMMADDHPMPPRLVDVGENREKLEQFKRLVGSNHVISQFRDETDLARKILTSVDSLFAELGLAHNGIPDLDGYWASVVEGWEQAAPEDMRVDFDPSADPFALFDELDSLVEAVEQFQQDMADSSDELSDDILQFLEEQGLDTQELRKLPYYENPFIHWKWERITFFMNVVTAARIRVAHLRLHHLEMLRLLQGDGPDLQKKLESAKAALREAARNGVLVD